MLIVRRRVGERIVITGGIEITVAAVSGGGVRLAIKAPRGVAVIRGEVHDSIVAANSAAMESPADDGASQAPRAPDAEAEEESRHAS
jgi:carbon storage regulator CsrA